MTTEELSLVTPISDEDFDRVIKEVTDSNGEIYSLTKLAEECSELAEIVLKKVNKLGTHREPTNTEIAEEIADVVLRAAMLGEKYDLKEFVGDRMSRKLAKLKECLDEGKYLGRI